MGVFWLAKVAIFHQQKSGRIQIHLLNTNYTVVNRNAHIFNYFILWRNLIIYTLYIRPPWFSTAYQVIAVWESDIAMKFSWLPTVCYDYRTKGYWRPSIPTTDSVVSPSIFEEAITIHLRCCRSFKPLYTCFSPLCLYICFCTCTLPAEIAI